MLIDMHVHTAGISDCASASYREMIDDCAAHGVAAVVLCNHYNALYLVENGGRHERCDYVEDYIAEYNSARAYGESKGVKVLFGVEVALVLWDCPYAEFLLYGITPDILRRHPYIYELNQQQLYELMHSEGVLVFQAHPYRKEQGHFPHDMRAVDGVEINCHYRFLREQQKVNRLAEEWGLLISCGSDYHKVGQAGTGGMLFDEIADEKDLAMRLSRGEGEIFLR